MILPLDGERKPKEFLKTQFNEAQAKISPNDQWIASASNESGRYEIYVASFSETGPGPKRQISIAGGQWPSWRPDGRELFYFSADGKLMAVKVDTSGTTFHFGPREELFAVNAQLGDLNPHAGPCDVAGDGQRFLFTTTVVDPRVQPITAVVNWTNALQGGSK